jgi:hypothetical protein
MFWEVIGLPAAVSGLFVRDRIRVICRNMMRHYLARSNLFTLRSQDMWMAKLFQPPQRLSLMSVTTFVPFGSENVERRNQCIE